MEHQFPIVIGSRALCEYGFTQTPRDTDLIVNSYYRQLLINQSDKNNYDNTKILYIRKDKIDLIVCEGVYKYISDVCNRDYNSKTILLFGLKCIIPPLEFLYAIKKSHIHRILPLTQSQSKNLLLWYRQIDQYTQIRNRLGYQLVDKMIYQPSSNLDLQATHIFHVGFQECNKKFGDTISKFDKNTNEFFKDNVKRFIDHDGLHQRVAMLERNSSELLFKRFQSTTTKVEMDENLFNAASPHDKIQTLKEEIIVLFLERKLLPTLNLFVKHKLPPQIKYDKFSKILKDVCSHFITNLCGSGDHWLRRFGLDHWSILSSPTTYSTSKIIQLGCDILGLGVYTPIKNYASIKEILGEYNNNDLFYIQCYTLYDPTYTLYIGCKSEKYYRRQGYLINNNEFSKEITININNNILPQVVKLVLDKIANDILYIFKENNRVIILTTRGIGLIANTTDNINMYEWQLFSYSIKDNINEYNDYTDKYPKATDIDKVKIRCNIIDLESKIKGKYSTIPSDLINIINNYLDYNAYIVKKVFKMTYDVCYYYSTEKCEGMERTEYISKNNRYVSSYGDSPTSLEPVLEFIAKTILKCMTNGTNELNSDDYLDYDKPYDSD